MRNVTYLKSLKICAIITFVNSVLNIRLPNNRQITTNNISGLLWRSRPLCFIEDQLSLKNRIVKNTSRKINGVLDTYLQETRRKEA